LPWFQDYVTLSTQTCKSECFSAPCDWSRNKCWKERASLAACPLFDATVLQSTSVASTNKTLSFVMGGTARFARLLHYLL
jgi:hypothetical protein